MKLDIQNEILYIESNYQKRQSHMLFRRLHHRLIGSMVGLMVVFVLAVGFTLHWSIRQSLENALGDKLQAVALSLAARYTPEEILWMKQGVGDRYRHRFLEPLNRIRKQSDIQRVCIFSIENESWLDTDTTRFHGQIYYQHLFFQQEMAALRKSKASHTLLFTDIDNRPMMAGFAPLIIADSTAGGIGVFGNAHFLGTVDDFNRRILTIGALGMGLAIVMAYILSRSVTKPVAGLVRASRQIGAGHYTDPIPPAGTSEIGELSKTMESMRMNVI
ncbi:HAMP domain-containing protein, partial [bacterium]|nr:HAMP domain-containing protein [bacterium]